MRSWEVNEGSWVTKMVSGRVGVVARWTKRAPLIQFGPSGPYERVPWGFLRPATPDEIKRKTGE